MATQPLPGMLPRSETVGPLQTPLQVGEAAPAQTLPAPTGTQSALASAGVPEPAAGSSVVSGIRPKTINAGSDAISKVVTKPPVLSVIQPQMQISGTPILGALLGWTDVRDQLAQALQSSGFGVPRTLVPTTAPSVRIRMSEQPPLQVQPPTTSQMPSPDDSGFRWSQLSVGSPNVALSPLLGGGTSQLMNAGSLLGSSRLHPGNLTQAILQGLSPDLANILYSGGFFQAYLFPWSGCGRFLFKAYLGGAWLPDGSGGYDTWIFVFERCVLLLHFREKKPWVSDTIVRLPIDPGASVTVHDPGATITVYNGDINGHRLAETKRDYGHGKTFVVASFCKDVKVFQLRRDTTWYERGGNMTLVPPGVIDSDPLASKDHKPSDWRPDNDSGTVEPVDDQHGLSSHNPTQPNSPPPGISVFLDTPGSVKSDGKVENANEDGANFQPGDEKHRLREFLTQIWCDGESLGIWYWWFESKQVVGVNNILGETTITSGTADYSPPGTPPSKGTAASSRLFKLFEEDQGMRK